jgi:general secretion pathway protein M
MGQDRRAALDGAPASVTGPVLPLAALRIQARARWKALAERERKALVAAAVVLTGFLVWSVAIAPAWRTVRAAPAQLDRLDNQLQRMQVLAAEARHLRESTPISTAQSASALKAATEHLGARARLAVVGDRATLTLSGVSGEGLRQWLAEARNGARARVVEAQLSRGPQGLAGTVVLMLAGAPGGGA